MPLVACTCLADALGALLGGVLFTFVLIRWLGPVQTLGLAAAAMALAAGLLRPPGGLLRPLRWLLWPFALPGGPWRCPHSPLGSIGGWRSGVWRVYIWG